MYRYDSALRLVAVVNENDETYLFSYNLEGRIISETGFDGRVTDNTYDLTGNVTSTVCAGQRTEQIRDSRGLLIAKTNEDGTVHFIYDGLGQMIAATSPLASHKFTYNPIGKLIVEQTEFTLSSSLQGLSADEKRVADSVFIMTHEYDELGFRIRTILPDGRQVDTLRYGSGHWHGTCWQGESIIDIERDCRHRERVRHQGRIGSCNRLLSRREHDAQSRVIHMTLSHVTDSSLDRILRDRHFAYDLMGNLLSVEYGNDVCGIVSDDVSYTYDKLGRILSLASRTRAEGFRYDPNGNLLDKGKFQNFRNECLKLDGDRYSCDNSEVPATGARQTIGSSYCYDERGNVIEKSRTHDYSELNPVNAHIKLKYDGENRLIQSVTVEGPVRSTVDYYYHAFSRRLAKRVVVEVSEDERNSDFHHSDVTCDEVKFFVWDGDLLTQEISERESVTFLYEPESFVPMMRIVSRKIENDSDSEQECSNWLAHSKECKEMEGEAKNNPNVKDSYLNFYHCDYLGTPREMVNERGKIVWSEMLSVWGRIVAKRDVVDLGRKWRVSQPIRFQGQYEDDETGLFYNRYRYYDPDSGTYLSQDPIRLRGGLNLYSYPTPTSYVDPRGLVRLRPTDPPAASLTNLEVRCWYLREETLITCMLSRTNGLRQRARQAVKRRNEARIRARLLMSDRSKAVALYTGNEDTTAAPMMRWKDLMKKYGGVGGANPEVYDSIIASSQRSRKSVNTAVIGDEDCEDVLASIDKRYGCK